MRIISFLLLAALAVGCQQKGIDAGEIEKIVNNHLENNLLEIERIKKELRESRISHLESNRQLVSSLE